MPDLGALVPGGMPSMDSDDEDIPVGYMPTSGDGKGDVMYQ
jgi:hypothetical protein